MIPWFSLSCVCFIFASFALSSCSRRLISASALRCSCSTQYTFSQYLFFPSSSFRDFDYLSDSICRSNPSLITFVFSCFAFIDWVLSSNLCRSRRYLLSRRSFPCCAFMRASSVLTSSIRTCCFSFSMKFLRFYSSLSSETWVRAYMRF